MALGRIPHSPVFVAAQVLQTFATFFVSLSLVYIVQQWFGFLASLYYTPHSSFNDLYGGLKFKLSDLFGGSVRPPVATPLRFFFLLLFTGVVIALPLARILQRRKYVTDYISTVYAAYLMLCAATCGWVILGWWFIISISVSWCVAVWLTLRRVSIDELADIPLGGV